MGRGNQIHTRFKLESRGNQVRKVIKMLQSTTARTGNLCGNKTTFGGHFACRVCQTFPCIALRQSSPHQTRSQSKGMQVLGLSLPLGLSWGRQQPWVRQAGLEGTAVSPEVPHWAHPQPSTQPTQLSALHITSLSSGHGELPSLADLGRNKSSLAPAGLGTMCLGLVL